MRGGSIIDLFTDMQHNITTGASNLISTGYGSTSSNNTPASYGERMFHRFHWQ